MRELVRDRSTKAERRCDAQRHEDERNPFPHGSSPPEVIEPRVNGYPIHQFLHLQGAKSASRRLWERFEQVLGGHLSVAEDAGGGTLAQPRVLGDNQSRRGV
jgi:hypothetical protein